MKNVVITHQQVQTILEAVKAARATVDVDNFVTEYRETVTAITSLASQVAYALGVAVPEVPIGMTIESAEMDIMTALDLHSALSRMLYVASEAYDRFYSRSDRDRAWAYSDGVCDALREAATDAHLALKTIGTIIAQ